MAASPTPLMLLRPVTPPEGDKMREAYHEYIKEHPEELTEVLRLIRHSKAIEMDRQERIDRKLALIEQCREELNNAKASNKRSRRRS